MATETASPTADVDEVEAFITHLYPLAGQPNSSYTFCGLHVSEDQHALMHKGYRQKSPRWTRETGGPGPCPACGAPLCSACKAML